MPPASDRRRRVAFGTLLVVLTIAAYAPAINGGFFGDDGSYVTDNAALRSAHGLWRIWFVPRATDQYYPLVFTSFWLEHQLWGTAPLGYHVTNIVLHAVTAVLVWILLLRLEVAGAWLGAALFALHPVHVESVAWVAERKDVLSGALYVLTVLVWLRFVERRGWRFYALALVLFAGAMLSKTLVCTLPLTLAVLAWWKRPERWQRQLPLLLPLLLLSIGLGSVTAWREHLGPKGDIVTPSLSALERGLQAGRALWFYAGKLLWPANLMREYPRWSIDATAAWQYVFPVSAAAVVVALWALRRRWGTAPFVAVLFFALTLSPSLGFIYFDMLRLTPVADHLLYLPSIGLLALAAAVLVRLAQRFRVTRWLGYVLVGGLLAVCGALTWQQTRLYHDAATIWRDTVARNPDALIAHYNLGTLLMQQGKADEAIAEYRETLRLYPAHTGALNNWGTVLVGQGKTDDALVQFNAVLRANPGDPIAEYNIGTILGGQGKLEEGIAHLRIALIRGATYAPAHENLGVLLLRQGKSDEAIQHMRRALELDPQLPKGRERLQRALAAAHDPVK